MFMLDPKKLVRNGLMRTHELTNMKCVLLVICFRERTNDLRSQQPQTSRIHHNIVWDIRIRSKTRLGMAKESFVKLSEMHTNRKNITTKKKLRILETHVRRILNTDAKVCA